MNVILLDIDGVLNSQQQAVGDMERGSFDYVGLNRIALGLLKKVCELTGAKIIISSTWRYDGHEAIAGAFEAHGWRGILISKTVIGVTDDGPGNRGEQIQRWLDDHPECTNYVIIDDDSDMLDSQKDNFVNTDSVLGFNMYDMVKCIDILGVDPSNEEKVKQAERLKENIEWKMNRRKDDDCGYTL